MWWPECQLFLSSWSMQKAGIISDLFVAAEQGLESALPLDASSCLIRKCSEESASSLTVILPCLGKKKKRLELHFYFSREWLKET